MPKPIKNLLLLLPFLLAALILILALFYPATRRQESWRISMILKTSAGDNEFWDVVQYGARSAARDYGVALQISGPDSEVAIEQQNEILSRSLAQKPDAIILSPLDSERSSEAARAVKEAHIPLVTLDSTLNESIADNAVQTDNIEAGRKLAALVCEISKEGQQIGLISHVPGSSTAIDRLEGLRQGLEGTGRVLLEPQYGFSNREKSAERTRELLTMYPDLRIIIGLNEWSACGAGDAVRDLGLGGKVRIVGFDNSSTEASFMEQGYFYGVVVQKPFNMGYQAVENACLLLQRKSVPKLSDSGSAVVRARELGSDESQKLMFPFVES